MRFDHDVYFNTVRNSLFGGSLEQVQVDGQNVILAVWEAYEGEADIRWLAYMLATTFHETAERMWPISEYGGESYLKGKDYYPYYGRGFVQLTWEDNYRKASSELGLVEERDLVEYPEVAKDSLIATRVMFRGMTQGWFTGKKLSQYFDADTDDSINARQIINGNDDDDLIAGYHRKFLAALQESVTEGG